VNLRHVIFSVYLAIFAALSATAGLYFVNMREQYGRLKAREIQDRRKLEDLQRTLADQQRALDRLRSDPAYVERVIRRSLGYAKEGEAIFTFPN
jgi:cell division protein FtsB